MADPGVRQSGSPGRPCSHRPELDCGQRPHSGDRPGRSSRDPTTSSPDTKGLDRADLPDRHGHECGQGAEHQDLLHGRDATSVTATTALVALHGVVSRGLRPYRHRWRCLSTWWAPPPSKRVGRAIPVRRVRFPSTSASRSTGTGLPAAGPPALTPTTRGMAGLSPPRTGRMPCRD
jgi:hypothetical protein